MSSIKLVFACALLFATVANAENEGDPKTPDISLIDRLRGLPGKVGAGFSGLRGKVGAGFSDLRGKVGAGFSDLRGKVDAAVPDVVKDNPGKAVAAVGTAAALALGGAYKAELIGKRPPVVVEPPQQRKESSSLKRVALAGAALTAAGVGAVAFADQIKERVGENKVTNVLVGAKNTFTGNKGQTKNDVSQKTTKNSASSVAVGATAFAAVAFAIVA